MQEKLRHVIPEAHAEGLQFKTEVGVGRITEEHEPFAIYIDFESRPVKSPESSTQTENAKKPNRNALDPACNHSYLQLVQGLGFDSYRN